MSHADNIDMAKMYLGTLYVVVFVGMATFTYNAWFWSVTGDHDFGQRSALGMIAASIALEAINGIKKGDS